MTRRVRLLRGAEAERAARLTPGDRWEALLDATLIREAAEAQARATLAQAQAQADRMQKEAAAEGRERGMAAVSELLVAARAESARTRRESTGELRALAVKIADKLLGRALALDPSVVVDLAAQALEHAGEPRALRLRCHPDDLDLLEHGRPRLLDRCRSLGALRIEASDDVPRGGCVLESELGAVDARLSTQLDAIERALRGDSA